MLSESEALQRILSAVQPLTVEEVPVSNALGRFAAQPLLATVSLPSFDNSQVDGYAVLAKDAIAGAILRVIDEQPAGEQRELALTPGNAIRIFTGAAVPAGADAVIMQEDVQREGDQIRIVEGIALGENIRRAGSDLCRGQVLLRAGERISPVVIGLLASQGLTSVRVHRAPRIGVLSTGDELIAPGQPLRPGQLYNSNGPMLIAMLADLGITNTRAVHCGDTLEATMDALRSLLADNDAIIISGGVSVGDHDHVKPALAALGVPPDLWRVNIKPGKPFLFAQTEQPRVCVFGLPGNPVSSFVTFQRFVRPALLHLTGANEAQRLPLTVEVTLSEALSNDGGRPHYVRGQVAEGVFKPVGVQQSHALHGLSKCNALLCVDAGATLATGSRQLASLV